MKAPFKGSGFMVPFKGVKGVLQVYIGVYRV